MLLSKFKVSNVVEEALFMAPSKSPFRVDLRREIAMPNDPRKKAVANNRRALGEQRPTVWSLTLAGTQRHNRQRKRQFGKSCGARVLTDTWVLRPPELQALERWRATSSQYNLL
jgi:hypothetical protein